MNSLEKCMTFEFVFTEEAYEQTRSFGGGRLCNDQMGGWSWGRR